ADFKSGCGYFQKHAPAVRLHASALNRGEHPQRPGSFRRSGRVCHRVQGHMERSHSAEPPLTARRRYTKSISAFPGVDRSGPLLFAGQIYVWPAMPGTCRFFLVKKMNQCIRTPNRLWTTWHTDLLIM